VGLILKKLSAAEAKKSCECCRFEVRLFESGIDLPDFREFFIKIILSDGAHSAPSEKCHPCDETLRHVATFAKVPWPGMSCHVVTFA
jgi:hypothetical protein